MNDTIDDKSKILDKINEINTKLDDENISGDEYTRLMFEQMLRGLYLQIIK